MAISPKAKACLLVFALSFLLVLFASAPSSSLADDAALIKEQYVEYCVADAPSAAQVKNYMESLKPDGTWPDINYADANRSGWKTWHHLYRVEQMARAYRAPDHPLAGDSRLEADILTALRHWLAKDYKNPTWWYNNIGAPMVMANILVLIGDELPENMVDRAMATTMSRAKIGMTGQNKLWLAGIVFVRTLTDGNAQDRQAALDAMLAELRVTTAEGVQPDWSFHQHGPQQQFGNYGSSFGGSMTKWAIILRGSDHALDDRQRSILRNYLLEGPAWILWKGRMDISGCGRQIRQDCQNSKGERILSQLDQMIQIDPTNRAVYEKRLKANTPDGRNTLIGNKHFWRSDMMVHRRPTWYASVKMSSRRVIGAETCNSENMRGMHLGDGALFVYQTATEYENIFPYWDWHRLPGTTCDQSLGSLVPSRGRCTGRTTFVGGVSDGTGGVAVLDYRREGLTARKSWFLEDDAIVCLGAGITANGSGTVLTSVEQSRADGEVTTSIGTRGEGTHALHAGDWVLHAGIGYHLIQADKPTLRIAEQQGNWNQINTTGPDTPRTGDVFSLWLDHGEAPRNQRYAYIVYPNTSPVDMSRLAERSDIRILANTPDLQAIAVDGSARRIRAVFFVPGTLEVAERKRLETDTPCLVSLVEAPGGSRLYVSDPTQTRESLQLKVAGVAITVKLPTGPDAGQPSRQTRQPEHPRADRQGSGEPPHRPRHQGWRDLGTDRRLRRPPASARRQQADHHGAGGGGCPSILETRSR